MDKTILVVEDEEELRNNILNILKILGFTTIGACDGEEGLKKAVENEVDLIISDIKMPKKDGYEFLDELRKIKNKIDIPFIFLTSNIERSQIRKGMDIGADDYITKPFETDELINSIKRRFEKSGKLDKYYQEKFEQVLNKYKKVVYYDLETNLPNLNSLNKDIINYKLNNDDEVFLFDVEIDGANEITYFLSKTSIHNLKCSIIKNIKQVLNEKTSLYHINDFEFVIVYKTNNTDKIIDSFAIKTIELIKQPFTTDEVEFYVSASIGINSISMHNKDIDNFLKNAQLARFFSQNIKSGSYKIFNNVVRDNVNKQLGSNLKKFIEIKSKNLSEKKIGQAEELYESKIFFLYPQSIIQDLLIKEIIKNEYAAYIVNDHIKIINLLKKYPNSVLFINIDVVLTDQEWQEYIKTMQLDTVLKNVRVGVLSFHADDNKVEKYVMNIMVSCGFIKLKSGFDECLGIILKALEAVEARGKRKYIRVKCEKDENIFCNIKLNKILYKGVIRDISTAGMAFYFTEENQTYLKVNMDLDYIQINLKGIICFTSGKIAGIRESDNIITYVIIFEKMNYDEKNKIYEFIYKSLKEEVNKELQI